MFTITELTDMELVNRTFRSPNNAPWAASDSATQMDIPYIPEKILYIGCYEEATYLGCVLGIKDGDRLHLHIGFLPPAYGHTVRIGLEVLRYIATNYPEFLIYSAQIAANNRRAQVYVEKAGFRLKVELPDGWLKGGIEHGSKIYEIEVRDGKFS